MRKINKNPAMALPDIETLISFIVGEVDCRYVRAAAREIASVLMKYGTKVDMKKLNEKIADIIEVCRMLR